MSYGSPSRCAAEWVQIYFAIAKGIIPVAAAGNEFESGNRLEFPALLPARRDRRRDHARQQERGASDANSAVDLSATGVGILTAVPPALDGDGVQDGYQALDGTSFSAPMVSAAMAWVRAARPDLTWDRVVQAIRLGATDVVTLTATAARAGIPLTGFGVLNVGAALNLATDKLPIQDPLEPDDNIVWVDGTAFGKQALAIWSGGKANEISGLLDKEEDPVDVYRIVIPGNGTAKVSLIPRFGDPQLEVFKKGAISVYDTSARVGFSHRAGAKKTDG